MICIIPCKSFSERLSGKNFRKLNGKMLFEYSVDAALESGVFKLKDIIVSSRNDLAVELCKSKGITHHWRSEALESPTSTVWEVCKEVIEEFNCESFAVLLPTSPLRTSTEIKNAYKLFESSSAECLMTIQEYEHPPAWALEIVDNKLEPIDITPHQDHYDYWSKTEGIYDKRQDLTPLYKHNGSVIMVKTKSFNEVDDWFDLNITPFKCNSIDINSQADFDYVEYLLSKRGNDG